MLDVMVVFDSIKKRHQDETKESIDLFLENLSKQSNIDKKTIFEYVKLYKEYMNTGDKRTKSGDKSWTMEEKMFFKFFYNHLKYDFKVKDILRMFSEINGRTFSANQFHFYNNRSFYVGEQKQKETQPTHLKANAPKVKIQKEKPSIQHENIESLLSMEKKEDEHLNVESEEHTIIQETPTLMPLLSIDEEKVKPKETSLVQEDIQKRDSKTVEETNISQKEDTLLSDIQTTLENVSKISNFDISGLFSGLSTLTTLATKNEVDKEELERLKDSEKEKNISLEEKNRKIFYLEEKIRKIQSLVSRFESSDSVYKITKLNDFIDELKDLTK